MKKNKLMIILLAGAITVSLGSKCLAYDKTTVDRYLVTNNRLELPLKKDVDTHKAMTVNFNKQLKVLLDNRTLNLSNVSEMIRVVNSKGNLQNIGYRMSPTSVSVIPPEGGYAKGEIYTLIVTAKLFNVAPEVIMDFTTGGAVTPVDPNALPKQASIAMSTLLKEYQGGKDFNRTNWTPAQILKRPYLYKPKEYFNIVENFDKKYRKPEYAQYTDPLYFMKMPGAADFSKANVGFGDMDNVADIDWGKTYLTPDEFRNVDGPNKAIITDLYSKSPSRAYYSDLMNKFIWRPDTETDVVKEINTLRAKNKLKPLKASDNLTSIAKFCMFRNFNDAFVVRGQGPGNSYVTDVSPNPYKTGMFIFWGDTDTDQFPSRDTYCGPANSIPFAYKDKTKNVNAKYTRGLTNADTALKDIFNLKSTTSHFVTSDSYYTTPNQIIYNQIFKPMEYCGKPPYTISLVGVNEEYTDLDINSALVKNKNITEIGVGAIYTLPHNVFEFNGVLSFFIVAQ